MAERKKTDKSGGSGVDLLDKEKAKNKVQPPKKYKVVYHNDDYTPMELVVISLVAIFHRSNPDAFKIMMHVHEKGKGIAQGGLSKEIAETKTNRVVQWFREQGYPLLATFEPEE